MSRVIGAHRLPQNILLLLQASRKQPNNPYSRERWPPLVRMSIDNRMTRDSDSQQFRTINLRVSNTRQPVPATMILKVEASPQNQPPSWARMTSYRCLRTPTPHA